MLITILLVIIGAGSIYVFLRKSQMTTIGSKPGGTVTKEPCDEEYLYSEKDCICVTDPHACKGLDKEACEKNPNCYSFSRGGTCSCPTCEIWLKHQCLPKEN